MIFDYVCGGELFTYLRNAGKFTSQTCKLTMIAKIKHELT